MTTLVVTLLEEATVFEGVDTVYRYDLVPPVLQEPWALGALVEQAQALCEGDRGGAEVQAEKQYEEVAAAVRQALRAAGLMGADEAESAASAAEEEQAGSAPVAGMRGDPLDVLAKPRERARHRYAEGEGRGAWWRTAWRRLTWFHAAMVGVVLAVAGLSWWSLGDGGAVGIAPQAGGEHETGAAEPQAAESEQRGKAEAENPVRPAVVHEVGAIRVTTPEGFQADLADGVVILTGLDADLRIRISADPLFSVPPEEVLREVGAEVGRDPTLSDLDPLEPPREEGQKMRYREEPGDGSQVQWSAWVESGHHISVGCQTKREPHRGTQGIVPDRGGIRGAAIAGAGECADISCGHFAERGNRRRAAAVKDKWRVAAAGLRRIRFEQSVKRERCQAFLEQRLTSWWPPPVVWTIPIARCNPSSRGCKG